MALSIDKLHPRFCAEISGVDLAGPIDEVTFGAISDAFDTHAVLVFRGQKLDDARQVAFSKRFGPLERNITDALGGPAEIANLSNIDRDGAVFAAGDARALFLSGNQYWHTDSSFKVMPAIASALSAREVPPEGGETEYADMRAAYDALGEAEKRKLEGLVAEHSYGYSQGKISLDAMETEEIEALPPVRHPMIRVHPATGRKALYIGRHASRIIGWPVDEGRAYLDDLLERATAAENCYSHRWRVGDLVMWDNRRVLHRGRPYDIKYRRVMHRTTIADPTPGNPWAL